MVTSRLDSCTQGVVLLGKSRAFVAAFNELMRQDGAISKSYSALSATAPPLGALEHRINPKLNGNLEGVRKREKKREEKREKNNLSRTFTSTVHAPSFSALSENLVFSNQPPAR